MNLEHIRQAKEDALKFITRVDTLMAEYKENEVWREEYLERNGREYIPSDSTSGTRKCGDLKRQSMELSRSLVKLRNE
jgi:hypothetical protein